MADDGKYDNDDEELVESMGKLQEIQDELEKIEEEERCKVLKVKGKYNGFRRELYDRRNHIIQSISGFWVSAFLNHPAIAGKLSKEDEKVFKYMVSLEVEDYNGDYTGYSITFNFSPNPFFEGTKLTRTYFLSEHGTTNVTSTRINWKDGKENKGIKRRITDHSFFNWFDEEPRTLSNGVIDEMARVIREELWIDPLNYFKNEADVDGIDDDNDHDDKEDDDKNFNGSDGTDADNNHNDEGEVNDVKNDPDSFEQDEIKEQYAVEPDGQEEIEEQHEEEKIEEQHEEEEIEEQNDDEEAAAAAAAGEEDDD